MSLKDIRAEWEIFARAGETGIGAVRRVAPDHLVAYIEGRGEVRLLAEHIAEARDGKVTLALDRLPDDLREAVAHASDAEDPRAADRGRDGGIVS